MTNTVYFHNTIRDYDDESVSTTTETEEESPAASRRHTPLHHHHHHQRGVAGAALPEALIDSWIPITSGLNPEAENNDGKDPPCDSSEFSFSKSIARAPQSEGGKLEYSLSKSFTFKELRSATKKFHDDRALGEGSFGRVFKGWIDENKLTATKSGKGIPVAIKRRSQHSLWGHEEWWAEVKHLGKLYHPNLVKLFGYCLDNEQHILVYEFMPRGSLENHLYNRRDSSPLSWSVRMKIALGAAKGLAFLHSAAINVIHRGVTSSNILLDMDYNAKLSDFGLATDGPWDTSYISTKVVGSNTCLAPEYACAGHLSSKSDVYSFGAVLIEILSGRRAGKSRYDGNLRRYMFPLAKPLVYSKRGIFLHLDSHLEGQCSLQNAQKAANLALQCLAENAQFRPNMDEVVTTLEQLQIC